MKTLLLTIITLLSFSISSYAQTNDTIASDTITVKSDNFMDMQTKTLTSIFGENLDGNTTEESIGYLELLEKSDLPAEQKTELKSWYYLQATELTQKQKDSLGKAIEKKILESKKDE